MPCIDAYVPEAVRSPEDILNDERDVALQQLEEDLGAGIATIISDPISGEVRVEGSSIWPEGMADLCVLEALQTRDSLEWQLAAGQAGVQEMDFAALHHHSHNS